MKHRRWIADEVIYAIHDRQIAEHGGLEGIRDRVVIESALAKPRNLAAYGAPDMAELAAAYAFALVRNHGFADGNKRTAWIAARLFVADNGYSMDYTPLEAIRLMESLASGALSEADAAKWFRKKIILR